MELLKTRLYWRERDLVGKPGNPGILSVSKTTLWSWVREGNFPRPVKLGPHTVAWRSEDIQRWEEGHAAGKP